MRESLSFRVAAEGDFKNIFVSRRKCALRMAFGDGLGAAMLSTGKSIKSPTNATLILMTRSYTTVSGDNRAGRIPIHLSVAKSIDPFCQLLQCTGPGASHQRIAEHFAWRPMRCLQSLAHHRHSIQVPAMPETIAVLRMLLQRIHEWTARDLSSNVRNEHHRKFCPHNRFAHRSTIYPQPILQRIKSNKIHSLASKFWRCVCGDSSDPAETQNESNLTLETKIADERNQTTGTTTIECINDTKFYSIRKVRQLKDVPSPLHGGKPGTNEKLDEIIESIAQQANEMQEFLSTTASSKRNGKAKENAARTFLRQHQLILSDAVGKLREVAAGGVADSRVPHSSTPYRSTRNAGIGQASSSSPLRASSEYTIASTIFSIIIPHHSNFSSRGSDQSIVFGKQQIRFVGRWCQHVDSSAHTNWRCIRDIHETIVNREGRRSHR